MFHNLIKKIKFLLSNSLIKKSELQIFLSASLVGFFSIVNYNNFKIIKDTLVLSIPNKNGAFLLSSLKIWAVVPFSMLFVFIVNMLNRKFSLKTIFYIIASFYLSMLAMLPIYHKHFPSMYLEKLPNDIMHIAEIAKISFILKPLAFVLKYWPVSFVYIIAELWNTTIFLLVFWGFLNATFSKGMTKRIYPLLNLVGNSAGIIAAPLLTLIRITFGDSWENQVVFLSYFSIAITIGMMLSFHLVTKAITTHSKLKNSKSKNAKTTSDVSILNGLKSMSKSSYISILIGTIVIFNIVVNLTEIMWKKLLIQAYNGEPVAIAHQLSILLTNISIFSTLFGILLPFMLNTIGVKWTFFSFPVSAMLFVSTFVMKQYYMGNVQDMSLAALVPYVWAGNIGITILRAGKYTIYDTIKDMCLNILDYKSMLETKGLVDTIFSRIGKSFASAQYSVSSSISESFANNLSDATILISGVVWTFIIYILGGMYEIKAKEKTN